VIAAANSNSKDGDDPKTRRNRAASYAIRSEPGAVATGPSTRTTVDTQYDDTRSLPAPGTDLLIGTTCAFLAEGLRTFCLGTTRTIHEITRTKLNNNFRFVWFRGSSYRESFNLSTLLRTSRRSHTS
jgi:hypothetical protein